MTSPRAADRPESSSPSSPALRWDKIYEARQRLAQGDYRDPDELEAVANWLDAVFGDMKDRRRVAG